MHGEPNSTRRPREVRRSRGEQPPSQVAAQTLDTSSSWSGRVTVLFFTQAEPGARPLRFRLLKF